MRRRWWVWLIGGIAGLIVMTIALSLIIDEPLRRYIEQQLNTHLKGYTVRLGRLDLRPWSFSVDLYDVSIVQDANPEPPIIFIPRVRSGVHGRALLSARLVSDVLVEHPKVHINLKQFREEAADDVPLQERGWQEAVQAVSPLKVNLLRVVDAEVTYVDEAPFEPLRLTKLNLRAENIRNIQSQAGEYPSPIQMEANIFDSGKLWLEGHADFLAVPHVALKAQLGLENVDLAYVKPLAGVTTSFSEGGPFQAREASNTPQASKSHTCRLLPSAAFGWTISTSGQLQTAGPESARTGRACGSRSEQSSRYHPARR